MYIMEVYLSFKELAVGPCTDEMLVSALCSVHYCAQVCVCVRVTGLITPEHANVSLHTASASQRKSPINALNHCITTVHKAS